MGKYFKIDFIGIGAGKSGTTWLFNALGKHPKICLSEPKEIKYFNKIVHSTALTIANYKPSLHKYHYKSFSWYQRHFKHCPENTTKGEFSPSYLYDAEAPSMIKKYFPDIKLIVCLRNPIDRAYSRYWARASYKKIESKTFEYTLKENKTYIEHGFYYRYLTRYLRYFNREQILVVLFDDILNQPEQELSRLFSFLGVCTNVKLDLTSISKNSAKRSRFISVEPIMRHLSIFLRDMNQI